MTPERFKKIKLILADALELAPEEQHAYLALACGEDTALLSAVTDLLSAEMDTDFLDISPITSNNDNHRIPEQIGRIKINQLLATGGMGAVYLGTDALLKRKVAVKVMPSDLHLSSEQRTILLNEAQALSSLQHPNICQIYDLFTEHSNDIMVLEYIEGQTLSQAVADQTVSNPLEVARSILLALTAAHERGIAHRDLKPENIMLTADGEIKILDFGLAKIQSYIQSDQANHSSQSIDNDAPVNQTQVAGTPGYMSPEQAQGIRATTATDLWSFGLILIELLSGEKPFPPHANTQELLKRARHADVQIPSDLSAEQKHLLSQLLNPEPAQRPSARTALETINQIISKPKRRLKAVATLALITTALFSGWKYTSDLNHERKVAIQASQAAIEARNQAEVLVEYMLNDLYTGLRAVGRTELLASTANKALAYYGSLSDEQIKLNQGMPALALIQIAEVFGDQGDQAKALSTLETAINQLQKLYTSQPDDELIMYRMADSYIKAANILKIAGKLDQTKQYAAEATTLGQRLTLGLSPGKGPTTTPDATERWRVLLRSIYMHADGHMRMGERAEAIALLEQGVAIAIPAATHNDNLRVNLADIQFKRCNSYYDANLLDQLLEPCLDTYQMDRTLYEANPQDFQVLQFFVGDHSVIANVYRKLQQLDLSLSYAQTGIELGEQLIALDPQNEGAMNEFVTVILALGQTQKQLGMAKQSQQTLQRALDIIAPIAADQEEISYMNSHFTALVLLGKIDQAKMVATALQSHGFKRRDFQDLCIEFNILECQINQTTENLP